MMRSVTFSRYLPCDDHPGQSRLLIPARFKPNIPPSMSPIRMFHQGFVLVTSLAFPGHAAESATSSLPDRPRRREISPGKRCSACQKPLIPTRRTERQSSRPVTQPPHHETKSKIMCHRPVALPACPGSGTQGAESGPTPASRDQGPPRRPHVRVARSEIRRVHPLGGLCHPGPQRVLHEPIESSAGRIPANASDPIATVLSVDLEASR